MNFYRLTYYLLMCICLIHCKSNTPDTVIRTTKSQIKVIPIAHGTLALKTGKNMIYIDPTGGSEAFTLLQPPTLVLITDLHGDHLSLTTLKALNLNNVTIIAPKAVTDKTPSTIGKAIITLANGNSYDFNGIKIEAIPMYNIRKDALKYHTKGRGNGYVMTIGNERIYISGDTEDIPEMRNLKNIDKAFICMNLPYTMTVDRAADAVLDFKPKTVYPYHYRGSEEMSDVNRFKNIVTKNNPSIHVSLLKWY